MSRIRELVENTRLQVDSGINSIENSMLITISRTEIIDNKISLPTASIGDVVFNMAKVFEQEDTYDFIDVTCEVSDDGLYIEFDPNDNLNGMFGIVTYLGRIINE